MVLPSGQSNRDLDFGYTIPIVKVKDNVIEQPAVDVPRPSPVHRRRRSSCGPARSLPMGFGIGPGDRPAVAPTADGLGCHSFEVSGVGGRRWLRR